MALALLLSSLFPAPSAAMTDEMEDDTEVMDYDSIVRELIGSPASGNSLNRARPVAPRDPFEDVLLHVGIGLVSTFARLDAGGDQINVDQRGFQATLGIDLFSEHWLAEGSTRSFGGTAYGANIVSLKEFDLKVYYHDRFSSKLGWRAGGGLAARYLTLKKTDAEPAKYSTPASIATLGLEYFLGPAVSMTAEISARNAMIEETIDQSSLDATLRLDTHF
jgi:hypothetical protein